MYPESLLHLAKMTFGTFLAGNGIAHARETSTELQNKRSGGGASSDTARHRFTSASAIERRSVARD